MARFHLFEWEDQPWLPRALRDFVTHHLEFTFSAPGTRLLRETVAEVLAEPLKRSGATSIVDVCSGGGGPLVAVLPNLEERLGMKIPARLTDLFPNVEAFQSIESATDGSVVGEIRPVSAFDVPPSFGRFQTVFTALHHFEPDAAKRVLADAAAKGRTIVVVEPFSRKSAAATAVGGFLLGVLRTPFMGRMTIARFLWTYPIPVAPMVLAWDGLVSCLRAYSPEELLAMGREVAPHYAWQAGEREVALPRAKLVLTFLTGEPPNSKF